SPVLKSNLEVAQALNTPQGRNIFNELGKQPSFLQKLGNIPILKSIGERLRGKWTRFTPRQVTNIGYVAVKSRSSMSGVLGKLWRNFGSLLMLAIGVAIIATLILTVGPGTH
ncbi:RxLR effector protein, partial [Phytophthora megakarya]